VDPSEIGIGIIVGFAPGVRKRSRFLFAAGASVDAAGK
jgi:hypothetical protein